MKAYTFEKNEICPSELGLALTGRILMKVFET